MRRKDRGQQVKKTSRISRSRRRRELTFSCTGFLFVLASLGFLLEASFGELLWVIEIEAHAAHCGVANAIIMMVVLEVVGRFCWARLGVTPFSSNFDNR